MGRQGSINDETIQVNWNDSRHSANQSRSFNDICTNAHISNEIHTYAPVSNDICIILQMVPITGRASELIPFIFKVSKTK